MFPLVHSIQRKHEKKACVLFQAAKYTVHRHTHTRARNDIAMFWLNYCFTHLWKNVFLFFTFKWSLLAFYLRGRFIHLWILFGVGPRVVRLGFVYFWRKWKQFLFRKSINRMVQHLWMYFFYVFIKWWLQCQHEND